MENKELIKEQFTKFQIQFLELIKEAPKEFHDYWDKRIDYIEYPFLTIGIKAGSIDYLPIELQGKYYELRDKFKNLKL
ncbi:hypothetical protein [Mucilaginibacter paludis]|uniref:Uncharacterized protein n=1 Tax=Mucilaginibacter paludis DSM 18603 TaxID=714943 RepID=H1Y6K7_9SPHI|nr:hypothetical protein [Mucilaginibacter paludis]EHQ25851.1 hypothetical protein Mucpa_1696 [Mucilaginibacter paludis DSM 18603]